MNSATIIIMSVMVALVCIAIRFIFRARKRGGFCGSCSGCTGGACGGCSVKREASDENKS